MTRKQSDIREKGRAVFLAALMVVSMFAIGATFAGTAAASHANLTHDDVTYTPINPWAGQDVNVTIDITEEPIEEGDEFALRRVTDTDDDRVDGSTARLQDVVIDEVNDPANEAYAEIETDDLDAGDYFISGHGLNRTPLVEDQTFEVSVQTLDVEWDDDEVTDEGDDAETELDIDSNRGTYSLNVNADGDLDDDELLSIFVHNESLVEGLLNESIRELIETDANGNIHGTLDQTTIDQINDILENYHDYDRGWDNRTDNPFSVLAYDPDEADADETVVMYRITDREEEVDFTDIDAGEYEFEFNVDDTAAEATATITVREEDVEVIFDQDVYEQTGGDILEITVEFEDTEHTYIQFGDEDSGFVDILYVEDDGGEDDEATFRINLRTIGQNVSGDAVVWSDDDIVESLIGNMAGTTGETFAEGDDPRFHEDDDLEGDFNFTQYLEELDLLDDETDDPWQQIVRPIHGTDFDLTATAHPDFIAEDGESEVDDEHGLAVLDITRPDLGETTIWIGPEDDADDTDDLDELLERLTERDTVALDDLLVVQFEASGLYGAMTYIQDNDFEAIDEGFEAATLGELTVYDDNFDEDWAGEGINLIFEEEEELDHRDETRLLLHNVDDDEVFILVDNDAGEMYLIVNTDDEPFNRDLNHGDQFEVELEYETDGDDRFRFDPSDNRSNDPRGGAAGNVGDEAYPYFAADREASTSATFTFQDRSVTFDNVLDGLVQIANTEESVVSGTTNVAPGTSASVRVRNRGDTPSFLVTQSVDIDEDGAFSAEFDFSAREIDDEARVSFRVAGSRLDQVNAIFVEEVIDVVDYELTVNVEDADGNPVDDASVRANGHAAETDADGVAVMTLPAGDYDVRVDAPNFERGTASVTLDEDTEITITLEADDELEQLRAEIEELQTFIDHLEQERDSIAAERDELADEVDRLEGELADRDAQISDLEDRIAELEEQPGFGLVVALVALLAAAGLAVRYRRG